MWTLFGSDGSGSAAVEMALMRCAVPFTLVRASTWEPESALAQLRQVNPLQQIPTLQFDDGSVAARAQALRGLVFIAANCYAAIGVIDYPERWCPGSDEHAREHLRKGARARLHACWSTFADQYLKVKRPAMLALLQRVKSRPDLAPVFARHWPG